mgnify:CR=1 FL=1
MVIGSGAQLQVSSHSILCVLFLFKYFVRRSLLLIGRTTMIHNHNYGGREREADDLYLSLFYEGLSITIRSIHLEYFRKVIVGDINYFPYLRALSL